MKHVLVAFIVMVIALPLSADVIVSGIGNSYVGGGAVSINLPQLFPCTNGGHGSANTQAMMNLSTNEYWGYSNLSRACVNLPEGSIGVASIGFDAYIYGEIPSVLTTYYQDSVPYIEGSWSVTGTVSGYYTYLTGQFDPYEEPPLFFFGGPAEYDFTVSGPLASPHIGMIMTFSTTAPYPVPEPSALVLSGLGLAAAWRKVRIVKR